MLAPIMAEPRDFRLTCLNELLGIRWFVAWPTKRIGMYSQQVDYAKSFEARLEAGDILGSKAVGYLHIVQDRARKCDAKQLDGLLCVLDVTGD